MCLGLMTHCSVLGTQVNLSKVISEIKDDATEVFCCGSGPVNRILKEACAARGVPFVGAEVE